MGWFLFQPFNIWISINWFLLLNGQASWTFKPVTDIMNIDYICRSTHVTNAHHTVRAHQDPSVLRQILTLMHLKQIVYSVDLEVWSKPAKRTRNIKHIASKSAHNFDCDWQRVNTFSHCITLKRVLLSQIISYSDTKELLRYKRANSCCSGM